MKGWEIKTLGEVCEVLGGATPSKDKPEYYTGSIPWATVRDMRSDLIEKTEFRITQTAVDECSTNIIPSGNVVIATRVGLGKICMVEHDTAINQDLRGIIPRSTTRLDKRFLFHWFRSIADKIVAEGTGATVQGVKLPFIKGLGIPLPPLDEQRRIVAILDEAFAGLAVMRQHAEANLKNARAVFDSHLNAIFSQRCDGWVETTLRDVCDQITDGTHQTPTYFDDGYIFLSSKSVTSGAINWKNSRFIDKAQHVAMQKRVSPKLNDILLAKNGTTGVAALVDRDIEFDIYVSLALLRPKISISPKFMLYFINSPAAKEQFNKRLKGVGVPNLHLQEIREVSISFPRSRDVQNQIAMHLDEIRVETTRLESLYRQKLAAIDELKQSILHRAFSGALSSGERAA